MTSLTPVYACLRNPSMVDYPGQMAAVFFTSGCNFSCGFCHNAELMGKPREGMTLAALEDHCRRFESEWVKAAVITGGEPTLCPDLPHLIDFFKAKGWLVKLDTNGSRPDHLAGCLYNVDSVALDIKTSPRKYKQLTGWGDTKALQTSLNLIREQAKDYELRTTVIEEEHDDETCLEMLDWVRGARRYRLQAFRPSDALPDKRFQTLSRTTTGWLERVASHFRKHVDTLIVQGA